MRWTSARRFYSLAGRRPRVPATPGQLRYAAACATRRSEATAQNHCYACDGLGFSAQPLEKLDDKKIADVDQWFRDADQGDEAIPF